jgi:biotin operon repressor
MDKIIVEYQLKTEELRKELGDVKKGLSDTEKQVETSGSKMSKTFMNVGKAIAAAFSVQMLIQFTKKSVELYNIQAKAEASLLQALKGREDIQKRLMLQASELQKVTLFGDEATIQAQAMLAKFGMTETQIKRLIPLIQDYATISGQDLSSAADMVARSVATSTNALVRYGIEIEGAAGSSERMESAVESLSNMVGGQAVAAAEAGTGAIQQYQNAWGDFSEKVGEVFVPAITALLNVGSKLIDVLKMSVLGVQGYTDSIIEEFTSQEYIFNESQKKFEEWLKTNRDGYSNLTEAGAAYVAQLEAEMRQVNRALADGDYTEERARNARRRINIEIEAIQTYVDEMTRTISVTNDLGDANDKLADKFKVNKKDLEAFINELRDLNSVSAGALELTGLNIDRVADAILNMEETLQRIKDTNSEYVDTTQEAADWTGAWFDISRSVFQGLTLCLTNKHRST